MVEEAENCKEKPFDLLPLCWLADILKAGSLCCEETMVIVFVKDMERLRI